MGALIGRQQLHISYHGRRKDDVSERDISPQRLTQYRNSWYLDAWCHKAEGLRSFALERIRDQKLLGKDAREVPADVLGGHFDSAYGIFSGPAEHVAKLKFTAEMSRWIAEEQWHPDQKGSYDDGGAWTLELPFSSARELVMDIMRYGPEVEVISPGFLRAAVAESARKTAAAYEA
jgi:predicted DNA-binding transcriptional regulator YafY